MPSKPKRIGNAYVDLVLHLFLGTGIDASHLINGVFLEGWRAGWLISQIFEQVD